jgi:cathepsin F
MNARILITLALLCIVSTGNSDIIFQQFLKFKEQYNKSYPSIEEFLTRFEVFKHNFQMLQNKNPTHETGITKYFDLTQQEFRNIYLNLRSTPGFQNNGEEYMKALLDGHSPDSWDWRNHGAVGPVKDQGDCGSCFSFSTVGNLEGLQAIKSGKIVQYSEQQIVDCDTNDGGCDGGWMESAFEYIKEAGGIETEQDYPYTGEDDTCAFIKKKAVLQVKDKIVNRDMDEKVMKEFLFKNGPLAIALNAESLIDYKSGIIDESSDECYPKTLNHGVTLVGYGSENGKYFWIVKNSFGADWGEKGYFRIARGKGTCGINTYVTSAVLA